MWNTLKNLFNKSAKTKAGTTPSGKDTAHATNYAHLDLDMLEKKQIVQLESTYNNQKYVFRRSTDQSRITLGEILKKLLKLSASQVLSMGIVYGHGHRNFPTETRLLSDADDIWNLDLFQSIKQSEETPYRDTTLCIKTEKGTIAMSMFALRGVGDYTTYMRVSVLVPYARFGDNQAPVVSFVLSHTKSTDNPGFQLYSEVKRSAERKMQKGNRDLDPLEYAYIIGCQEFSWYPDRGMELFEQQRYHDAYVHLERCFNHLKPKYGDISPERQETFRDVCLTMAECLSKMNREEEATYFYSKAFENSTEYPGPLAMNLTRRGDLSALQIALGTSEGAQQFPQLLLSLKEYKQNYDQQNPAGTTFSNRITIGYALKTLWGMDKKNIVPCMAVFDTHTGRFLEQIETADSIAAYQLDPHESAEKIFVTSCTYAHYLNHDPDDKSVTCVNAPIVIYAHKAHETTGTIRVDMYRHNFAYNDLKRSNTDINYPLQASFLIGQPDRQEFHANKADLLAATQTVFSLMSEQRFIEALHLSQWLFECSSNLRKDSGGTMYESDDEQLEQIFYVSGYQTGYCLMELENKASQRAQHYLSTASRSQIPDCIMEYINCLVNNHESQALDAINQCMSDLEKFQADQPLDDHLVPLLAFLKRRKVYVLIEMKRCNQAQAMLEEMVNEPESRDFARNELQYVEMMITRQQQ